VSEIKRTGESPGVREYYSALQRILDLQRGVLTGVLTHRGERGRNDEERLRQFLIQTLPGRFAVGTGFIVSGNPYAKASNQTDIIISDRLINPPIHRELAAEVYPIETVLATIEVKGTLSGAKDKVTGLSDLGSTLESIALVRTLAQDKQYIIYRSVPKKDRAPDHKVVSKSVLKSTLPPRSFLFAYHTDQWDDIDKLGNYIVKCLQDHPGAHLHGVVVLDKDWFFRQESFTGSERRVTRESSGCLLKFLNALLHGIQSIPMYPMDIDMYHDPDSAHFLDKEDSAFSGEVEVEDNNSEWNGMYDIDEQQTKP
jgi:hypothetical protein